MRVLILCSFVSFLLPDLISAQIKGVFVEDYYIVDQNDATDTFGGQLEVGTKTFRIFVQLESGYQLKSILGTQGHPLIFSSSQPFFNHKEEGKTFAKDFNKNRFKNGTVALDSWLTIGQIAKASNNALQGVLKSQDTDGSIIGGINNDGGSAEIPEGLLNNKNSQLGIPLTVADGMAVQLDLPEDWGHNGIIDNITSEDSTIFGSSSAKKSFFSESALLQNSGVKGVHADKNDILIAQLTTKGELSFELNCEIEDPFGNVRTYVARNEILGQNQTFNKYLKYPPVCGCLDPDYLEYSPAFTCSDNNACKTFIVFGCIDTAACNFNPSANFNIPSLCCYIGNCIGMDINLVCPQVAVNEIDSSKKIEIYYHSDKDELIIKNLDIKIKPNRMLILDMLGKLCYSSQSISNTLQNEYVIHTQDLLPGVYVFQCSDGKKIYTQQFCKL